MKKNNWISHSLGETKTIAHHLSSLIKGGDVLCFYGELGAGKTSLIKEIIACKMQISPDAITSPTFNYMNQYGQDPICFHFDLYRLQDWAEFESMGFVEMFDSSSICFIEWPEKILPLLPEKRLDICIHALGENKREFVLS